MRILYILSGTGTKGGATKSFLAMADRVAAAGNEIAVVVPDNNGVTPVLRQRGWTVVATPYEFCALPRISWRMRDIVRFIPRLARIAYLNLSARKHVVEFAKKWMPDIVHDNTSVTDIGHYAALAIGVPHVIHVREYGWKDFRLVLPWLKQRMSHPYAYVVAITSDLAQYRGKYVVDGHIRTVYNGVIRDVVDNYSIEKDPFFLYAGRIMPLKGVDDLVTAYVKYACDEINSGRIPLRLKLAGIYYEDAFFDGLKKKISINGLEGYVDWLGNIENVEHYYSKAVATVIPSMYEGFGRVMPEAMSAGCICVVRNAGGLAEQLDNGRRLTGREIAFGFDSVDELAGILAKISHAYMKGNAFESGGRFKKMIDDSRQVVGSLYTSEANGKNILDYYSDIIHDVGRQGSARQLS